MEKAEFIARAMIALRAAPYPDNAYHERLQEQRTIQWLERTAETCASESEELWAEYVKNRPWLELK